MRRSLLFVPGNNEKMITKALSQSLMCDCVIFDLEDSVPFEGKESARHLIKSLMHELEWDARKRGALALGGQLVDAVHYKISKEILEKTREDHA